MCRISSAAAAGCLAALCFSAGEASAQIQQRADGRLSDANPMIGSGGYNPRVPGPPINSANLIVTGNVTGGRAFQGFSPIRNPSQFYISPPVAGSEFLDDPLLLNTQSYTSRPSAGLSDFYRDTVGVQDILGGASTLYQPRPYFSPDLTITNAGAIAGGLNVPGTSIPRDAYALPYQDLQLPQAQMVVSPEFPLGDTRLEGGNYLQQPLPELDRSAYSRQTAPGAKVTNPWIAQSNLFNSNPYLRRQQQEDMPSLLHALRARQSAEMPFQQDPRRDMTVDPTVDLRVDRRIDTRISAEPIEYEDLSQTQVEFEEGLFQDYALPGGAALPLAPAGPAPSLTEQTIPTGREGPAGRMGPDEPEPSSSGRGVDSGGYNAVEEADRRAEAYRDKYMQQRRQGLLKDAVPDLLGGQSGLSQAASAGPGKGEAPAGTKPKVLPGEYSLPRSEGPPPRAGTMEQVADIYARKVVTLVGQADTRLNRQLAVAEALTRAGQYFRAAGQYEIAAVLDPASPLPHIGQAYALIGAGDYHAAARHLIRGIRAWPGFTNFRLDLNSFITDPGLLDRRRADLEQRLAERETPEFRFLLGYIEWSMGLEEFGLENLEKAAATAPRDSLMATFPNLLRQQIEIDTPEPELESGQEPQGPAAGAGQGPPDAEPDPPE